MLRGVSHSSIALLDARPLPQKASRRGCPPSAPSLPPPVQSAPTRAEARPRPRAAQRSTRRARATARRACSSDASESVRVPIEAAVEAPTRRAGFGVSWARRPCSLPRLRRAGRGRGRGRGRRAGCHRGFHEGCAQGAIGRADVPAANRVRRVRSRLGGDAGELRGFESVDGLGETRDHRERPHVFKVHGFVGSRDRSGERQSRAKRVSVPLPQIRDCEHRRSG